MADEVTFDEAQQKLVDKLVGEARVKASAIAVAQAEAAQAKLKEDSEKAALVANQKWQELAAKHEARVKELEPLEAQAKAYGELIAGMLKDRIKALGDAAKKAVGALPEGMASLEKLNWLTKNEALFQATGDGVGTPGSKKSPKNKKSAADVGHRRLRL